jgi:hypothetical protein
VVTKPNYEACQWVVFMTTLGLSTHSLVEHVPILKVGEGHLALGVVVSQVENRALRLHAVEDGELGLLVRHCGMAHGQTEVVLEGVLLSVGGRALTADWPSCDQAVGF